MLRPISEIYEESADFWAQQRATSSFFEEKYLRWVLEQIPVNGNVLDLGCGNGDPIAHYFLKNHLNVVGIDVAKSMIELARAKFPSDVFPAATWFVGDMKTIALSRTFHAIIAWDSFFHLGFTEQENMFPVFRKHLDVGGVLIFTSGPERGEAIGEMNGNALFHASLSEAEYRERLAANGFEVIHYDPRAADCGGHTIWRCRVSH